MKNFAFGTIHSLVKTIILVPLVFVLRGEGSPSSSTSGTSNESSASDGAVSGVRRGGTLVVNNVTYNVYLYLTDGFRRFNVGCAAIKGTNFVATYCVIVIPIVKLFLNGGYAGFV